MPEPDTGAHEPVPDPPLPDPYPTIGEAVWILALVFAAGILIQVSVLSLAGPQTSRNPFVFGGTNLFSIGLVVLWRVKIKGLLPAVVFPLHRIRQPLLFPLASATVGLTILLSDLDNALQTVLPAPQGLTELFRGLGSGNVAGALFVLVLVAPVTEEFLFRGLILQGFRARYSARKAIFWSALLFAVFHLNPWQFAGALVLGLLFGWLVVRTGTLVPGLIGHAVANGWPLVLGVLDIEIRGFNKIGESVEFQPLWMNLTGLLLTLFGLVLLRRTLRSDQLDSASPTRSL